MTTSTTNAIANIHRHRHRHPPTPPARFFQGVIEVTSEVTSHAYEPLFGYIEKCEAQLAKHNTYVERSEEVTELIEGHEKHHEGLYH